ncbi:hypothetical protein P3T76_001240 [Phytophthora citrophthora]|uniref:RxLR effector PexRD54 WY domain-containing protein n=1 Tax=Phytophthora citrophthora TaxID=4793 RepID=A0AAD9GY68_9STRA|nr:hypothetical protein P3T76_001240 [Phytophthora citrophthora]
MFVRYLLLLTLVAVFIEVNSMDNIVQPNQLLQRNEHVSEERNPITTSASTLTKQAKSAAELTEKMQLKLWLSRRVSGDEVFVLLNLDKTGENLLANPQWSNWVMYMTQANKNRPKTAIISALTARYGDEGLAKMLLAAKQVSSTKETAMEVQVAQMREWLRRGKSVDDIFELLKLDNGLEKLLTNPNLSLWVNYMTRFNERFPSKKTSMIDTFSNYYGDEAMAKMLEAAKKDPRASKLASELQTAHFKQWLNEGAKPYMIFKMLKMNKETWMKNPDANIWRLYNEYYKARRFINVSP